MVKGQFLSAAAVQVPAENPHLDSTVYYLQEIYTLPLHIACCSKVRDYIPSILPLTSSHRSADPALECFPKM